MAKNTNNAAFPPVLDACCGSRMFWFDKKDSRATFVDKRRERHTLPDISDELLADRAVGAVRELLDSRIPKSEREHAAVREIERLRGALEEVRSRSSIGVINSSNRTELEVVLGDICLYVDAVLWQGYLLRDQED